MVFCSGCDTQFSLSGRSRHWAQTSQHECLAAAEAYRKQLLAAAAPDDGEEGLARPFEGDYFGDYDIQDFRTPNDNEAVALSDHDIDMLDEHGHGSDALDLDRFSLGASGSGLHELDEDEGDADDGEEDEEAADADDEDEDGEDMDGEDDEDEEDGDFEPSEDDKYEEEEADFVSWEPPLELGQDAQPSEHAANPAREDDIAEEAAILPRASRQAAENNLRRKTFIVRYAQPLPSSGHRAILGQRTQRPAYSAYKARIDAEGSNPWAPFQSQLDWEVARWAKTRGPGSTALTELLAIKGLPDTLGLSFKTAQELNKLIDEGMPSGRPQFKRREIIVQGEVFEVYYRDVLECIRALFGDPEFAKHLLLFPEMHYTDATKKVRLYFDVNTGDWWWKIQQKLDKRRAGGTVIPIIISSDKTQLTVFGNKSAYPVYLTIGNLPKDIRRKPSHRGQILLAYLPTSNLEHITNKAARRRTLSNLFHACMRQILSPLQTAGEDGVSMTSGDGRLFRCHPILAAYVGDYPEQTLVACCKKGDCPKCPIHRDELGNSTDTDRAIRDISKTLDALDTFDAGPRAYNNACKSIGIKPIIHPFWENLPYIDIYAAITPDILHQLYQGVVKHLVSWIKTAYSVIEIDARCRRMPPNHNLRHFAKGISKLQRVTGKEHADICRILIGLIIGLPLPDGLNPARLVRATRALLDFLYVAQYPVQTTETLELLRDGLTRFHANKDIFVTLGIRTGFNIPKLHGLDHYPLSTRLLGSLDNFDTQYSECLHIDFAKEAYRATNRKDEFSQMTLWLERREKVQRHDVFLKWRLADSNSVAPHVNSSTEPSSSSPSTALPPSAPSQSHPVHPLPVPAAPMFTSVRMTRHPSAKGVPISRLIADYGATYFHDALARFLVKYNNPELSAAQTERAASAFYVPFNTVSVYHKIKFVLGDVQDFLDRPAQPTDVIHARPARTGKYGKGVPGRFDTALVNDGRGAATGVEGYRVGQIRVVFTIPRRAIDTVFPGPNARRPQHLAYVEWFTAFTEPDQHHDRFTYMTMF
ncbi:hypothetical protein TRAPUB_1634 [Trametes pubescens]|uniref:C2H2-type domain-containing protein n=1 Tax=Trametes pubescens TaxID=154538 RepID=A0A1M2VIZ4_TRAPU|nr:hypothetical protein TRAPUB_1634 [Trametes pubescens]